MSASERLPELVVPRLDPSWRLDTPPRENTWHLIAPHLIAPCGLVRAEDGGAPLQPTSVRLGWTPEALFVRFDCVDAEPWATLRDRDAPLWREEAVELFLAAGPDDPADYVEIEVNPLGALFDARIENPRLDRSELRADLAFAWPGIRWQAGLAPSGDGWWAALALPWAGLPGGLADGAPPDLLRANFYRIDRPRAAPAEHSAWSPTLVTPADFHRPRRFGTLLLAR